MIYIPPCAYIQQHPEIVCIHNICQCRGVVPKRTNRPPVASQDDTITVVTTVEVYQKPCRNERIQRYIDDYNEDRYPDGQPRITVNDFQALVQHNQY